MQQPCTIVRLGLLRRHLCCRGPKGVGADPAGCTLRLGDKGAGLCTRQGGEPSRSAGSICRHALLSRGREWAVWPAGSSRSHSCTLHGADRVLPCARRVVGGPRRTRRCSVRVLVHSYAATPAGSRGLKPQLLAAAAALQGAFQGAPAQPPQPTARLLQQRLLLPCQCVGPPRPSRVAALVGGRSSGGACCALAPGCLLPLVPQAHAGCKGPGASQDTAAPGAQSTGCAHRTPRGRGPR